MHKTSKLLLAVYVLFAFVLPCHAQEPERVVYGAKLSPYVFKVLVAMEEKALDYTNEEVLSVAAAKARKEQPSAELIKASPLGKIPAYREGEWTMADSAVITAYLDKQYPQHPLYPSDPKMLANTLWFEKYGDEVMSAIIRVKIFAERVAKPKLFGTPTNEATVQNAINDDLPPIFSYLEKALEGKEWICGEQFTAADIAIGAQLRSLKMSDVSISSEKYPNLARYNERLLARASFKKLMQ